MAKFDFNSIKDSISKRNPFKSKAEEDFDDEGSFDDEFVPENTDENEEFYPEDEDSEYTDENSGSDEEYDEEADSDEEYPEDDNSDEYYEEADENESADGEDYYGDGSSENDNYDDEDYTADEDYAEDDDLDDYEDDGEDLGYNPDLFDEIRNEDGGEQYDDAQYDDEYDEYAEEGEEGDEYEEAPSESGEGWYAKVKRTIDNNPILLYALLALPVLQLFAIWYMWHKGLFDKQKRWILTAIGALFIILWVIIFWPRGGSGDPINNDPFTGPDFSENVVIPQTSATPTPTPDTGFEPVNTPCRPPTTRPTMYGQTTPGFTTTPEKTAPTWVAFP